MREHLEGRGEEQREEPRERSADELTERCENDHAEGLSAEPLVAEHLSAANLPLFSAGERASERRSSLRCHVRIGARYGLIHRVELVEVGAAGARLQGEQTLAFGRGELDLSESLELAVGSAAAAVNGPFEVRLLWSRLFRTSAGPFGEVCPHFVHGLRVERESLGSWQLALRWLV